MPAPPQVAQIHFRITAAGEAAEQAVTALKSLRVFPAKNALQTVAMHLNAAAGYATEIGAAQLAAYLTKMAQFYLGQAQSARLPRDCATVAQQVAGNSGNLLGADPAVTSVTMPT